MKNFIIKSIIGSILIVFVYSATISELIDRLLGVVETFDDLYKNRKQLREDLKIKFRNEIDKAVKKEKIFYPEDRVLIKKIIEKIIIELDINTVKTLQN